MSTELQPGELLIQRYRLMRLIGMGAMGAVWSARDEQAQRTVALKLLHPSLLADPVAIQRFFLEAEAASKLAHRSIVKVFQAGRLDKSADGAVMPYMAMELLDGQTLGDVMRRHPRVPVPALLEIVRSIAEGLAVAHAAGIVHRDIKPANIFLHRTQDGIVPMLLDFGISKFVGPSQDGGLTVTGDLIGSPTYMSPEQVTSPRDIDARSDLWALGMVLYRGLSGRFPFDISDAPALLTQIAKTDVDMQYVDAPADVVAIVTRCLRRRREERFANASELTAALALALSSLGVAPDLDSLIGARVSTPYAEATLADVTYPMPPPVFPVERRRSRVALFAGLGLAVVFGVVAWVATRTPASTSASTNAAASTITIPSTNTNTVASTSTMAVATTATASTTVTARATIAPHASTRPKPSNDPSRRPGF